MCPIKAYIQIGIYMNACVKKNYNVSRYKLNSILKKKVAS